MFHKNRAFEIWNRVIKNVTMFEFYVYRAFGTLNGEKNAEEKRMQSRNLP